MARTSRDRRDHGLADGSVELAPVTT